MKKICMLLVLLSGVAFAADKQEDICKKQDLGGCETLFICPNTSSFIVKYKRDSSTMRCLNEVDTKYFPDAKEQKFAEVPSKK